MATISRAVRGGRRLTSKGRKILQKKQEEESGSGVGSFITSLSEQKSLRPEKERDDRKEIAQRINV